MYARVYRLEVEHVSAEGPEFQVDVTASFQLEDFSVIKARGIINLGLKPTEEELRNGLKQILADGIRLTRQTGEVRKFVESMKGKII